MLGKLNVFKHEMLPCSPADLEAHVQDVTEMVQALDDIKDLVRNTRQLKRAQKTYLLHQVDAIVKQLYADVDTPITDEGGRLN